MDKNKKTFQVPTLLAFAAIVAIMVIVGVRVLNVPVVPMCLLVIIEAVIAVMLHHAELWVHGLLILAELCAGVAGKKTVLIILCAVVYRKGFVHGRYGGHAQASERPDRREGQRLGGVRPRRGSAAR